MTAASIFASRAVRQYRSRDIFPYLSLRYFLDSQVGRTDQFLRAHIIQILRGTTRPEYLEVSYFKERNAAGEIKHRSMHMPCAYEALAEAIIIDECASKTNIPDKNVCFSYWANSDDDTGYFRPYMEGLKARQAAVAAAIEREPESRVQYLDIKQFYPSISCSLAESTYDRICQDNAINEDIRLAGLEIIRRHGQVTGGHILTGPMMSHLIGNLILCDIDAACRDRRSAIFRYVDDFIIVGDEEMGEDSAWLIGALEEMGLRTHDSTSEKSVVVPGSKWLESAKDFESGPISTRWMKLIGNIKSFLLLEPGQGEVLLDELVAQGFRLPLLAYQTAVREVSTWKRVREANLWGWLIAKAKGNSISKILNDAAELRAEINSQLNDLFAQPQPEGAFDRKRRVTKIRYRLGRSLYLSDLKDLEHWAKFEYLWPELEVHFAIIDALLGGCCDRVIAMGGNVAQAAAQIFSAAGRRALFEAPISTSAQREGLAIFIANGVAVDVAEVVDGRILQLATGPVTIEMMSRDGGFIQDLACLHGVGEARHQQMMNHVYDLAEEVHFDAISLDYGYSF